MESSKRPSLVALPLIAISILAIGMTMTQRAFAADERVTVKSATTGITAVEQLMDRIARRAAERRSEEDWRVRDDQNDRSREEDEDDADDRDERNDEAQNVRADDDLGSIIRRMVMMRRNQRIDDRRDDAGSTRPAAPANEEEEDAEDVEENEDSNETEDRGSASGDAADRVFELVNAERAKHGLSPYSYNRTLEKSAREYSAHMRDTRCFSHTACGSTLKERMHASGYYKGNGRSYSYGENIARGQDSAAEVMEDWMNSPSHRGAILSTKFKEIGIGRSGDYWTQHFGAVR